VKRAITRCKECNGVAQASVLGTMVEVSMVRQILGQLTRLGCPDETTQPIKDWTDQTYKQCTCARAGFGFARPM
jgi:hypothetical protein